MKEPYKQFVETEITKMFDQFNLIFYICGMKYFWVSRLNLPVMFEKIFDKFLTISSTLMILLLLSSYLALFTQSDLTPRQSSDLKMLCLTSPVIYHHFYALLYYRSQVRDIFYHLAVILKEHYCDKETERQMVKKMKLCVRLLMAVSFSAIFERGANGVMNVILSGTLNILFRQTNLCCTDVYN